MLVILFMSIYFYILLGLVLILGKRNRKSFLHSINKINTYDKIGLVLVFISLGGLPPFLGFLIKLVTVKFVLIKQNILLIILLVFLSLMLLFHYLSRSYYLLTIFPNTKLASKLSLGSMGLYSIYFLSLG